jgi:dienelactone hydrolase
LNLTIEPADALLDEPVAIRVSGVAPGSRITLSLRSPELRARAVAEFVADERGAVDTATQAPVAGDYDGIDAAGLFWSARFEEGADLVTMLEPLTRLDPVTYAAVAEMSGTEIARAALTRRVLADNVEQVVLREGRLRGVLFAPRDAVNAPGIVVLGGSDGGLTLSFVAALLAAHGYAALALGYFGYEDLPANMVEIPTEYFAEAIAWLRASPPVAGAPVGVLGMSRGGELALLLGATYPDIAAVVSLVPSGLGGSGIGADPSLMMRPAWTTGGQPVPFIPPPSDSAAFGAFSESFATGKPLAMTPHILRGLDAAGARLDAVAIPVERTRGPIFMMSGEDDQIWPSTRLTDIAVRRLEAAGFGYRFEHHAFPGAGHFACFPPHLPTTRNWSRHPKVPLAMMYGGHPRDTAAASAATWTRIYAFLRSAFATAPA